MGDLLYIRLNTCNVPRSWDKKFVKCDKSPLDKKAHMALARKYNPLDIRLYEAVRERVFQILGAQPASFWVEVLQLKQYVKEFQKMCGIEDKKEKEGVESTRSKVVEDLQKRQEEAPWYCQAAMDRNYRMKIGPNGYFPFNETRSIFLFKYL